MKWNHQRSLLVIKRNLMSKLKEWGNWKGILQSLTEEQSNTFASRRDAILKHIGNDICWSIWKDVNICSKSDHVSGKPLKSLCNISVCDFISHGVDEAELQNHFCIDHTDLELTENSFIVNNSTMAEAMEIHEIKKEQTDWQWQTDLNLANEDLAKEAKSSSILQLCCASVKFLYL